MLRYSKTDDVKIKERIIFSIGQNKSDKAIHKLIEIARKEENVSLKKHLVLLLSQSKSEEAIKFLKEILDK